MAGIYQGDSRVFTASKTGADGSFILIGRQTEGSMEGEREEIDANHKFSAFSDILPGRRSGNITVNMQDMDDDPGQQLVRECYDDGTLIHIREESWDLNDPGAGTTPVRGTTGYVLSDPLGRDLSMDEIASSEVTVTQNSPWKDVTPVPA